MTTQHLKQLWFLTLSKNLLSFTAFDVPAARYLGLVQSWENRVTQPDTFLRVTKIVLQKKNKKNPKLNPSWKAALSSLWLPLDVSRVSSLSGLFFFSYCGCPSKLSTISVDNAIIQAQTKASSHISYKMNFIVYWSDCSKWALYTPKGLVPCTYIIYAYAAFLKPTIILFCQPSLNISSFCVLQSFAGIFMQALY